ncbi:hypothetical protein [Enterobacter kobei]|jgi:hypothetical protein|uniref:hypothetical protein n=1 Tax=Enterobacter kobei TaxID=208224 RepID=UPI00339C1AE2
MKALINDVIAVFTRKAHGPVIIKSDLTEEEKQLWYRSVHSLLAGCLPWMSWSGRLSAKPLNMALPLI